MKKLLFLVIGGVLACWCNAAFAGHGNALPAYIVRGSVEMVVHDGQTLLDPRLDDIPPFPGYPDDLLSGGLNADGLQSAAPPGFADPLNPTPTELRRLALHTNFRAITDMTTAGGYGLFWGPALAPGFGPDVEPGLIPGVEYKALMKKPAGSGNVNKVPVAVQIPDSFDPEDPCVFLAPPSGSRGYYGGIAVGEWGLFKGCAVVLPGKATGTGFHLLGTDEVYDRDGLLTPADKIGREAQFAVKETGNLSTFRADHPDRVATKHAHSQINPERLWGDLALQGIEFAFWALNDKFDMKSKHGKNDKNHIVDKKRRGFTPTNTLVIASGTSNGAGASLRALEKDRKGLIDGLVVYRAQHQPGFGRQVCH